MGKNHGDEGAIPWQDRAEFDPQHTSRFLRIRWAILALRKQHFDFPRQSSRPPRTAYARQSALLSLELRLLQASKRFSGGGPFIRGI